MGKIGNPEAHFPSSRIFVDFSRENEFYRDAHELHDWQGATDVVGKAVVGVLVGRQRRAGEWVQGLEDAALALGARVRFQDGAIAVDVRG